MAFIQSESVICPSWDLPNHCPVLLSNSDKDQSIPLIKSKLPTRHLLIYATDNSHHSTMTLVSTELDKPHLIRCVYPYLYSGMTIVSYYSLQEAQLALERFRKQDHSFHLEYAKPCLVNKRCNERVFVTVRQLQGLDIKQHHYRHHLQQMGTIDSLSETWISPYCVLINLEYDDERIHEQLYQQYHQMILEGCYWSVYFAENNDFTCYCDQWKDVPIKKEESYFTHDLNLTKSSTTLSSFLSCSSSSTTTTTTSTSHRSMIESKKKKVDVMLNETHLENIRKGLDTRTTYMIRNIPNKYTQKMLMDSINATHANTYDFLYLRIDFQNKCNVGYAFINFTDPKSVISFAQERIDKKWDHFNSDKRCALSFATIQGKTALIKKFKNSQVMSEDVAYQPKLFYSSGPNKGKEQPFPMNSHHRERKHQRA